MLSPNSNNSRANALSFIQEILKFIDEALKIVSMLSADKIYNYTNDQAIDFANFKNELNVDREDLQNLIKEKNIKISKENFNDPLVRIFNFFIERSIELEKIDDESAKKLNLQGISLALKIGELAWQIKLLAETTDQMHFFHIGKIVFSNIGKKQAVYLQSLQKAAQLNIFKMDDEISPAYFSSPSEKLRDEAQYILSVLIIFKYVSTEACWRAGDFYKKMFLSISKKQPEWGKYYADTTAQYYILAYCSAVKLAGDGVTSWKKLNANLYAINFHSKQNKIKNNLSVAKSEDANIQFKVEELNIYIDSLNFNYKLKKITTKFFCLNIIFSELRDENNFLFNIIRYLVETKHDLTFDQKIVQKNNKNHISITQQKNSCDLMLEPLDQVVSEHLIKFYLQLDNEIYVYTLQAYVRFFQQQRKSDPVTENIFNDESVLVFYTKALENVGFLVHKLDFSSKSPALATTLQELVTALMEVLDNELKINVNKNNAIAENKKQVIKMIYEILQFIINNNFYQYAPLVFLRLGNICDTIFPESDNVLLKFRFYFAAYLSSGQHLNILMQIFNDKNLPIKKQLFIDIHENIHAKKEKDHQSLLELFDKIPQEVRNVAILVFLHYLLFKIETDARFFNSEQLKKLPGQLWSDIANEDPKKPFELLFNKIKIKVEQLRGILKDCTSTSIQKKKKKKKKNKNNQKKLINNNLVSPEENCENNPNLNNDHNNFEYFDEMNEEDDANNIDGFESVRKNTKYKRNESKISSSLKYNSLSLFGVNNNNNHPATDKLVSDFPKHEVEYNIETTEYTTLPKLTTPLTWKKVLPPNLNDQYMFEIPIEIPEKIKCMIEFFHEEGFDAYIVGSQIWKRIYYYSQGFNSQQIDEWLAASDIDIVTPAPPEIILKFSKKFGLNLEKNKYDPALFSNKHANVDVYRVNVEDIKDLIIDALKRRDFTLCALFMSLKLGKVVFYDPTRRGLKDLKENRIVTILAEEKSFSVDAIRILRCIYLLATMKNLTFNNTAQLKVYREELEAIPREKLFCHLSKHFMGGHAAACMQKLLQFEILPIIFSCIDFNNKNRKELMAAMVKSDQVFNRVGYLSQSKIFSYFIQAYIFTLKSYKQIQLSIEQLKIILRDDLKFPEDLIKKFNKPLTLRGVAYPTFLDCILKPYSPTLFNHSASQLPQMLQTDVELSVSSNNSNSMI